MEKLFKRIKYQLEFSCKVWKICYNRQYKGFVVSESSSYNWCRFHKELEEKPTLPEKQFGFRKLTTDVLKKILDPGICNMDGTDKH